MNRQETNQQIDCSEVLCPGFGGFALGATPNAIANMTTAIPHWMILTNNPINIYQLTNETGGNDG